MALPPFGGGPLQESVDILASESQEPPYPHGPKPAGLHGFIDAGKFDPQPPGHLQWGKERDRTADPCTLLHLSVHPEMTGSYRDVCPGQCCEGRHRVTSFCLAYNFIMPERSGIVKRKVIDACQRGLV